MKTEPLTWLFLRDFSETFSPKKDMYVEMYDTFTYKLYRFFF